MKAACLYLAMASLYVNIKPSLPDLNLIAIVVNASNRSNVTKNSRLIY